MCSSLMIARGWCQPVLIMEMTEDRRLGSRERRCPKSIDPELLMQVSPLAEVESN